MYFDRSLLAKRTYFVNDSEDCRFDVLNLNIWNIRQFLVRVLIKVSTMARVFVVHCALKIFVLWIFVGQLNFARGQDDLYKFLEIEMDDYPEKNISSKCLEETRWMKRSLQNLTFWAVESEYNDLFLIFNYLFIYKLLIWLFIFYFVSIILLS